MSQSRAKIGPEGQVARRPLWAGRALALLGIVLVAANLRTVVGGFSPLIPLISQTYPVDTLAIAVIGALAPICFLLGGIITPSISRRLGLERSLLLAIALIFAGHVTRALSPNWIVLALGTLLALLGTGFGNVLLPPAVKKYFPDRIGLLTALYMTVMAIGSLLPPLIAVHIGEAFSWRTSLGQWAALTVIAVIPWVMLLRRRARSAATAVAATAAASADASLIPETPHIPVWRSPTAWAIGTIFAVSAINGYAMYAWMPVIMIDIAHVTPAEGGALLALFTGLGLPLALTMPLIANRVKRIDALIHFATLCFVVAYSGFIFAPTTNPWLWSAILGTGCLLFPLALALVNLRSGSTRTSLALSGFATVVAYSLTSFVPPAMGILFDATGSWTATLVMLGTLSLAASAAAFILQRGQNVEEDLRHARVPVTT
jgi:CP family cyanate transporter-like MFS transporter